MCLNLYVRLSFCRKKTLINSYVILLTYFLILCDSSTHVDTEEILVMFAFYQMFRF